MLSLIGAESRLRRSDNFGPLPDEAPEAK